MNHDSKSNTLPLIGAVLVLAITGWYGVTRWGMLSDTKAEVELADSVLFELEQAQSDVTQDYQDSKKTFVDMVNENKERIEVVFPDTEDLTNLTRAFDDFSFKNHYSSNPFFISQLAYGDVIVYDQYRALPITMNVETSERNFEKFLEYIETSGSLETGVQLMAINAITLQLNEDEDTLRVQLSLYAYLQSS